MNDVLSELAEKIRRLEERIEEEIAQSRAQFQVRFRGRIAEFAEEALAYQRTFKIKWHRFLRDSDLLYVLVAPVIYSVIVPLAFIDLWVTLYQHVCFRAYGIPRVKRSTYLVFDRHHLAYLNFIEKLNCLYCGYGNGVLAYAREVASRTEQFWCPIKHASRVRDPHGRYLRFLDYGDAQGYRRDLEKLRSGVRKEGDKTDWPSPRE